MWCFFILFFNLLVWNFAFKNIILNYSFSFDIHEYKSQKMLVLQILFLCTIDQKVKHQGFPGRHFHSGRAQHLVNHCHLLKRCGVDLSGVKMEDMIYNEGTFYVLIK